MIDYQEFMVDKSVLARANARKVLNKQDNVNGKLERRKDFVERVVKEGATISEFNGSKRLMHGNGAFYDHLTKTELNYAEYLISKRDESQRNSTDKLILRYHYRNTGVDSVDIKLHDKLNQPVIDNAVLQLKESGLTAYQKLGDSSGYESIHVAGDKSETLKKKIDTLFKEPYGSLPEHPKSETTTTQKEFTPEYIHTGHGRIPGSGLKVQIEKTENGNIHYIDENGIDGVKTKQAFYQQFKNYGKEDQLVDDLNYDLLDKSHSELKAIAKSKGIDVQKGLSKDDIKDLIVDHDITEYRNANTPATEAPKFSRQITPIKDNAARELPNLDNKTRFQLKQIKMPETVIDEQGNQHTIENTAEDVYNEIETRFNLIKRLRDCIS